METHRTTRAPKKWPLAALLVVACWLAFALRLYQLPDPALRWDEGWTIAHGRLPWGELIRIAALEWHPPLFYLLFKLWLSLMGPSSFAVRYLAVLAGVLSVPLACIAARAWSGSQRTALLAAMYAASAPLLVYYGQVNRMYAWTPLGTLLATWALLRATASSRPPRRRIVLAGLTAALALYLLYYSLWAIVALYAYVLITRRRQWRAAVTAALIALLLFAPWLIYTAGTVQQRFYATPSLAVSLRQTWEMVGPSIYGLVFAFGRGWATVWLTGGLLLLGLLLAPPRQWTPFLLPLLVVGITIGGVAYGAQAVRFFAVRHFVPSAPFLGLGLAWALDRLAARSRLLAAVAVIALVIVFWPTSSQFVYAKTLEVVDPFDPAEDWHYLSSRILPGDLVFFNNLAKAGWYEQARAGQGAPWSYTLRWEPIVESMETAIVPRIEAAMTQHERLWFVLYKGATGPNTDLRDWLATDERLYPTWEGWTVDTLFLGYVAPHQPLLQAPLQPAQLDQPIRLTTARFTDSARPGGGVAVELTWQIEGALAVDAKVFVHLVGPDGVLVAQHDARPAGENRPTQTLSPGETIPDRHGIGLPAQTPEALILRVGLYDTRTGERFLWQDGSDFVTLGTVSVRP